MVKVVASGYFDPLHIGHLNYLKRAKELGDELVVIVNNDKQAILKKGYVFMSQEERLEIVKAIKWVDSVVLSIDTDKTVCKTLEMIKPDIFGNGGDRTNDEIPEAKIAKKCGFKIIDGLGGKVQSSSELLLKGLKKVIN